MGLYGRRRGRGAADRLRAQRRPGGASAGAGGVLRVWEQAETPREELERLCGSPDHQGVVAEVEPYPYADPADVLAPEDALVVALDQVQDPQNLGAICRSAEARRRERCRDPRARRAPRSRRRSAARRRARSSTWRSHASATSRTSSPRPSARGPGSTAPRRARGRPTGEPDYSGRVVLVLGSEGKGLRPRVRAACDALVELPLRGRIGSLNVSAAAAALLYEIVRQRTMP